MLIVVMVGIWMAVLAGPPEGFLLGWLHLLVGLLWSFLSSRLLILVVTI
jgi:hypothetical protein